MKYLREVVNGNILAHSQNKNVSIIGVVTNINPNGKCFEIKTSDNITVTINLTSPLDDMLEGYVEVHGVCQSRNVINATDYIPFTPEQSEGFDTEGYNKFCALLQQLPTIYNTC